MLTSVLQYWGLQWKQDSLKYMRSDGNAQAQVIVDLQGGGTMTLKPVQESILLGTCLSHDGSTDKAFHYRLQKASRAFYHHLPYLSDQSVSIYARFERYATRIHPILLYGAGSWAFTKRLHQAIHVWEGTCLQKILGIKMRPDDTWQDWFNRTVHRARELFARMGFRSASQTLLDRIWNFAKAQFKRTCTMATFPRVVMKHCYGLQLDNPYRQSNVFEWLHDVTTWRDTSHWTVESCFNMMGDPRNQTKWKHRAGYTRSRMWDSLFYEVFGDAWREVMSSAGSDAQARFIAKAYELIGVSEPKAKKKKCHSGPTDATITRKRKVTFEPRVDWMQTTAGEAWLPCEVVGD
eukprot:12287791-Karenia_brevis.AAC.1